ncbi:MAG: ABC transporter permease subunit [Actinobacteria bacterium]|nr:ABC transporter permease subunit [Actinomycetota bacterium]MSW41111.1 ABC transporter permease subunit [Actinomycetota bacterium]
MVEPVPVSSSFARPPGAGFTRHLNGSDWLAIAAGAVVALIVLIAIISPWIAPYDPYALDPLNALAPPSPAHLLGTDDLGRDIFSRLLVGSRTTLLGPFIVVCAAAMVGTLLALTAAWFGGWYDSVISRALDILFAFPALILALTVTSLFGTGFVAPVVALSIAYVPIVARIMRAAALREQSLPYIEALEVQGFPSMHIWRRHLLPNLAPLLFVQCAISFGYAMLELAALSFLGLGLQPPAANWGLMIANGQPSLLAGSPEQSLFAALAVVVTVIAFTLVAENLAGRFEAGRP